MEKIISKTKNREYEIFFGKDLSEEIVLEIKKRFECSEKFVLVTDEKINHIYENHIQDLLQDIDKPHIKIIIGEGERSKNLNSLNFIYENLISSNIHRNDTIIAFGGGVIGDLSGFAASSFHRGINLVQYPTTLVGQVDSSIGGKVVVNFRGIKNIIGSFYQPHMVVIDQAYLETLNIDEVKNGLSEIIKYAVVFDKKILEFLEKFANRSELPDKKIKDLVKREDFLEIIKRCVKIKSEIVREDEFDTGVRNFLNFGHTIGHALEKIGGLERLSHGEAVGIGMAVAMELSVHKGLIDASVKDRVLKVLSAYKISHRLPDISMEEIIEMLSYDKKFTTTRKRFILLKGLNKPEIVENVENTELINILKKCKTLN